MFKKNQSLDTGESKKLFINIAQVPHYQPEIESFENYSDRLTAFLEVNKVAENEKISTLIAVISAEAYVILKDNVYPEKPVNKKYVDLIEVLKKHYSETLILSDRLKFNRRSQLPMETVAEYIQVLRQMASNCNYGEFLDEALRDRLIAGLNDVFLIKKLLAQPTNMTFTQASKICFNYETSSELNLRKNKELVQILPNTSKVKSQQNQQGLKILKAKSNVRRPINKSSHVRCREHGANRCPVWKKQWLHFQCGKKGNVSTICRTKGNIKSIRRKNENQPKTIITADNVKSIQGVNGDQSNTIETEDNVKSIQGEIENQPNTIITTDNGKSIQGINEDQSNTIETEDNVKSIQRKNENQPNTIITTDNGKSIQGINEDQSNTIKTEDNVKFIQRENENQPNTIIIADNGKSYPLISKEMINDWLSLSGLDTVSTRTVQNQQLVPCERQNIWQGIVEWIEKAKNPTDAQKQTRHIPCQVSANAKDGDPELKADTWPPKLIMQLMPKQLIGSIGGTYLKNSKSVVFHPTPCEALESLTKMMTAGFAGCVHFTSASSSPACEIKVLILLYTTDKKTYLGFIPNDQTAFVDRLRKVIQQQKTSQNASARQVYPGLSFRYPLLPQAYKKD
ncbi:uncharacterized protein LOC105199140 isoform X2 [Solenopsis invicta]|uniref:uncharacterized protein LOC105199140 isoform X2 n=1 Tax=Solenopsis invicta TaxID=13686 RepID=UPI00193CE10B|nr:uncharacterized protein LOC105199140 isoform X2 [Solenopsis invicta]